MDSVYQEIASKYGTPTYVYDFRRIKEQYSRLKSVVPEALIAYAVKANSNLSLLRFLKSLGAGFDIVSGGELYRVRKAGGGEIIFSGVGKTEAELRDASDVLSINVESLDELSLIAEMKLSHPISLRVNPDISVDTHPYISTGLRSSKFGIPLDQLSSALSIIKSGKLNLIGLSCHIGSHISDISVLRSAYSCLRAKFEEIKASGFELELLDFGGGLAIDLDLQMFGQMVKEVTEGLMARVVFEPGKFLVAESGVLLTRVLYKKDNETHKFAVVDAGMNDLIRPSLYDAYHEIQATFDSPLKEEVSIVGPVCETGCFLGKGRMLPVLKRGDLLLIRDSGAYGFSMSSNYNSRPRACEVAIELNGSIRCIRNRESYESLVASEP